MNKAKKYITQFDSASSLLYALSRYLKGRGFPGVGIAPRTPEWMGPIINALPKGFRQSIYQWSGWWDSVTEDRLKSVNENEIARWAVGQYPRQSYPAAMIGSSNGAAVHLCAALGIPWLPQTTLLTVRRKLHPDKIKEDLEWGRNPAACITQRNPSLIIHQMHDPLQDRLMISRIAYFRLKRIHPGRVYENFLKTCLPEGSTLFSLECRFTWPATRVTESHYFQTGGLGGLPAEEYGEATPRIEQFLSRQASPYRRWDPPEPNCLAPEAEWGYAPSLQDDLEHLTRNLHFRMRRIIFDHPEDLSFFVADLYRWWYRKRGIRPNRLLAECFAVLEPWWAVRTGCVPFWMAFNTNGSAANLRSYLEKNKGIEEIFLMLMSNGLRGIGLTTVPEWRKILNRAARSEFLGVDEEKYPSDFGLFIKYHPALKRKIKARHIKLSPLTLPELDAFIVEQRGHHRVIWR